MRATRTAAFPGYLRFLLNGIYSGRTRCAAGRRAAPLCQADAPDPGHAPALSRPPFRTTLRPPSRSPGQGASRHRQAPLKHPCAEGGDGHIEPPKAPARTASLPRHSQAPQASQGTANASRYQLRIRRTGNTVLPAPKPSCSGFADSTLGAGPVGHPPYAAL